LAAALANKLARIAWTVLALERSYEARITKGLPRLALRVYAGRGSRLGYFIYGIGAERHR
jgi:hypothetical protein